MSTTDAPLALPHSPGPAYAELHCHSNFSLLDGASSPEALVAQAQVLGLRALALTDHDSLAGAVRFQGAARKAGLPWIFGAEVTLEGPLEGASGALPESATLPHLTLLAETQEGYANLCRLISAARLDQLPAPPAAFDADDPFDPAAPVLNWPGKLPPRLRWERLAQHSAGLIVLTGCHQGPVAAPLLADRTDGGMRAAARAAGHLHDLFGPGQLYVELQHQSRPDDDLLVRRLAQLARTLNLPLVATNNVHYATRDGARLRDAFLAIDENIPLSEARKRGLLPAGSLACLTDGATMQRRFRTLPQAIANTVEIADRCSAAIDFSHHRLPAFLPANSPVSEFQMLYQLCHDALPTRYPDLRSAVLKQLAHELDVIERAGLAGYFLIVWDMVRFARSRGVRCQGRGSAANSIVAYLLGITSVDPLRHNLLFERFLSADKFTTPDIDVDFAADRREEVIRYVYNRYGRANTAMVCNVVTYRARSALRDLGKVLDFPEAVIERLIGRLEADSPTAAAEAVEALVAESEAAPALTGAPASDALAQSVAATQAGAPMEHPLRHLADLLRQIDGCPR
ncbi:MAG: PHP domain-containing protein, partial [Caldilineaceae bacterium]